ncbi:MAG: hypothetical protein AMJ75_06035 [Phycisphaerae bacterium SM1_79]|nr:MAG: hypothetical protein AMJ75_06035 [Phycisphaerae bacterium SM1_79]
MKNTVYIIVIVVCLVGAAVIAYKYIFSSGTPGGIDDIPDEEMTWVKCNNPACKAEYEMGLKAYYKETEERLQPNSMTTPALICEKCGKPSVYRAVKCTNPDCGIVFIRGIVPNDFPDRCPECKRSETEEIRKKRLAGGQ